MSRHIDNSGPAFPSHGTMGEVVEHGMTLRDYFAAKAISAILAQEEDGIRSHAPNSPYNSRMAETAAEMWACNAYEIADAMLKAREA